MEPTSNSTDQNRWWRAACNDTTGKLVDLAGPTGLPAKLVRDAACRATGQGPKAAPRAAMPARDTVEGVVRQGRQAMPAAPEGIAAGHGPHLPSQLEVMHGLEMVLDVLGVESKALATLGPVTGVIMLGQFLHEIGKANREGKLDAARAATAQGFATVMAEVLDRGHLRPSTLASLREKARALGNPELGTRLSMGVEAAAKALHGLTPAERNRIRNELLALTTHLQVSGASERQLRLKMQGLLLGWPAGRL
jgi:hypothetical protein